MPEDNLSKAELQLIDKIVGALPITAFRDLLWSKVSRAFGFMFRNTQIRYGFTHATPDPLALKYLEERVFILSDKTRDRLTGNLRWELLEGIRNTESISDIKKRLEPIFTKMHDYEIERIARTETLNAMNAGRLEAYEASEVTHYKMWRAAINNKRTAADSRRLHGQIQELSDPFVDPKTGDAVMHPPNRPNCRCAMIPLRKLPENVVRKGGQMYAADEMVGKIEIDAGSLQKTEKRIWVKSTVKRKGHYRKVKGAKKVGVEKPYADWKPNDPKPEGLDKGAYVDTDSGKVEVDVVYTAPGFFIGMDGKEYNIKDIIKLYPKSKKTAEEILAEIKKPEVYTPKEKFEIDSHKFFSECSETERDSNNLRSLQEYSGKNYNEVNEYLLTGKSRGDRDILDSQIRNISKILSKAPKYEGEVFRGMRFENQDKFNNFISQCGEGERISMRNFTSTSINKSVASKFAGSFDYSILCTIKSKNGVFLGSISENVDEREVLFNHESEFKISDIKEISGSKFEVTMEEV